MISKETSSLICDLLMTLSQKESKLEIIRQVIADIEEFDAYQVFTYLDKESKNFLTDFNIFQFLQKNGVECTIEEVKFIILFYDENFDGVLSYTEFLGIILSDSNFTLRKRTREKIGSNYGKNNLPFKVEYTLVNLFNRELELIRSCWAIIKKIKSRADFNLQEIYHCMKGFDDINSESIKTFLQANFVDFSEEDIRAIMKRMDINRDSKIDFNEFHLFFCFPNMHYSAKCNCVEINTNNNTFNNNQLFYQSNLINNINEIPINSSGLEMRLSPERKLSPFNEKINNIYNNLNNNQINSEKEIPLTPSLNLRKTPERKYINNDLSYKSLLSTTNNLENNNIQCCCDCLCIPCICCNENFELNESDFICYISNLMEIESNIEKVKIDLVNCEDFFFQELFRLFETDKRGIITEDNFNKSLNKLGIYISLKEIKLLMRRIDIKRNGFISYADFFDFLVPFQKKYRINVEKRNYNKNEIKDFDFLPIKIKILLQNLIRIIISSEGLLERLRFQMGNAKNGLEKIFEKMSGKEKNVVNYINFYKYLKNTGLEVDDLKCKLAFIRFDRKRNSQVEMWEIEDELTPLY